MRPTSKANRRDIAHLKTLARIATLEARVAELELALQPFAEFGEYIEAHPRRGLHDELYSWDTGEGAVIRQRDLVYAAVVRRKKVQP